MVSREPVVVLHSVAEAYLYLMADRCNACGRGPLRAGGELTKTADKKAPWRILAECPGCSRCEPISFLIDPPPTREQALSSVVNPTPFHSRAIDLDGWLTLFQSILAAAEAQVDKATSRQIGMEALMCVDEALKFYETGHDAPRGDAFFSDSSRQRFLAQPGQYSKSVWERRRAILDDTLKQAGGKSAGRRWYRFWRK